MKKNLMKNSLVGLLGLSLLAINIQTIPLPAKASESNFATIADNGTIRQVTATVSQDPHLEVWIDPEKDLDEQVAKLKEVLPKLDITNNPVEYIDLRIDGKVFFKSHK